MKCVYIAGTDFCGSTLLDRLFWMIPGFAAPGELHWLIDAPAFGEVRTRAGWQVGRLCTRHGEECPALPLSFVRDEFSPDTLYAAVAEQLDCEVLVSSDKGWKHYERFAARHSPRLIVLFKNPTAQSASYFKNEWRRYSKGLRLWCNFYREALDHHPDAFYVSYETLARYPNQVMAALTAELDVHDWVPVDPADCLVDQEFHHIGGNPGSHADGPIVVKHKNGGRTNREASRLFDKLIARSIRI